MTKKQFIKRMQLIQNFHSEQNTLSQIIERISDGHCVVNVGNYLIEEIIDMINEALNIKTGLISWWLYEDVDKIIYDIENNKDISVKTLDELWDYIIGEFNA
ncbi:MAG: hypothetical protein ACOCUI_02875 [bacterium]